SYDEPNHRPGKTRAQIEWSPNLVLKYQSSFVEGYALNRAWQEIPNSVFPGLVDTIRTRVLRFALELRDELGEAPNLAQPLVAERVDRFVTNIILGGNNVIAETAHDFAQIGEISVEAGNLAQLAAALKKVGVEAGQVDELRSALQGDAFADQRPAIGQRTGAWL